jgi:hypothetical protein
MTKCMFCRGEAAKQQIDSISAAARRVLEGASAPDRGDGYTGLEERPSGTRVSVDLDDLLALVWALPKEVTNV